MTNSIFLRIREFFVRRYYLLTSLLLMLSFPSYDFFLLKAFPLFAWFSLVPLFLFLRRTEGKETYFAAFFTGFWGMLLTYNWIRHFGGSVAGGPFVVMFFLIPALALFFALKAFVAEILSRKFPALRIVIFPAVWLLVDYIESLGHMAFPWPYMGYSQYTFKPVVQLASITGVGGITALIVMVNSALAAWIDEADTLSVDSLKKTVGGRQVIILGALLILIVSGGIIRMNLPSPQGKSLTVGMVQTCIDPWKSWMKNRHRYLGELINQTNRQMMKTPEMMIWSESATLETLSRDWFAGRLSPFEKQIFNYVMDLRVPLLTGEIGIGIANDGGRSRYVPLNNAVLIEPDGSVQQTYSKIHLVPFGEWFPYGKWLPVIQHLLDSFGASNFYPGTAPKIFKVKGIPFGTLVCYEGIFFSLARDYRNMGAEFLVNITNDGWTDTYSGHMQHFSASVFRAVENGIWYVRSGNTGYSVIVDPLGRETASMPLLTKGGLTGTLHLGLNRKTIYSSIGDVVTPLSIAFLVMLLMILLYRRVRKVHEL